MRQRCEKFLGGTQPLRFAARSAFAGQELVALPEQLLQLLLDTLPFGNVAKNLRSADYFPCLVTEGRNGKRDLNQSTVLGDAHGFVVLDTVSSTKVRNDVPLFFLPIGRNEHCDRLADDLGRRIFEQPDGRSVQEVIVPSSVLVMMASSDDSTTAARSARALSCPGCLTGEGSATFS